MAPSIDVAMELPNPVIRAQSTVNFSTSGHVSILSDHKETVPKKTVYTVTAVMLLTC